MISPLVTRELQVALRRPWTYRSRKWFGAGAMVVTVWGLLVWGGTSTTAGEQLFRFLSYSASLATIFTGIFLTSDSLSREKREGTLGFLFLTDLQSPDVILGKFAATAIVPSSILVAMVPGLAICQLAGGVTLAEFWRTALSLVITLYFVLSSTIYVSSHCESNRQSFGWATFLLLLLNPLWLLLAGFDVNYAPGTFWKMAGMFGLLGALFLYRGAKVIERGWRDNESRFATRPPKTDARLIAPRLTNNLPPITWLMLTRRELSSRTRLPRQIAAGAVLVLLVWLLADSNPAVFLLALFAAHLAYQILVLTRTAYAFYNDKQDGSLELLLSTRLSEEEIFSGFSTFLRLQCHKALWGFTLFDLAACLALILKNKAALAAFPVSMAGILWVHAAGVGWLGVYRALMTNHPLYAMAATFLRLSFFPIILSVLFLYVPRTNFPKVAAFWVISTGFLALFFGMDAHSALIRHGRTLLLRPYFEKLPHIENELSFINWDDSLESEVPPMAGQERDFEGTSENGMPVALGG